MRLRGRWLALGLVTIAQVAVALISQGVPTIAAFIQSDLALSRPEVGLVGTGMYIGSLPAMAAVGWAVDRFGERTVLGLGAIATGGVILAVRGVHSLLPLLGVLVLAGVGTAVATPAGAKAVMGWFSAEERGLAMGLRQTGIPVGGALAALLLPLIAARVGWRDALTVAGLVTVAGGLLTLFVYHEAATPPAAAKPQAHRTGWRQTLTPELAWVSLAGMLLPIGQFAMVTYLVLYLHEGWGIPLLGGAGFLLLAQLTGTAGRIVWGAASDHLFGGNRRVTLLWIAGASTAAALALGLMPARPAAWVLPAVIGFFGFTALAWQGIYMALVAELAGPERAGSAVGISLTSVQVGIVAGAPLFGLLAQAAGSYRPAWVTDAAAFGISFAILASVARHRARETAPAAAAR